MKFADVRRVCSWLFLVCGDSITVLIVCAMR